MERNWEILLSGTLGALIASLLSVWYQHISEQIKSRKDTMRAVIEWVDNIYVRLQAMQVYKERVYTGQEPSLSVEEYRSMSNEIRVLLLSDRIGTEVVCVYGEGDVLQKINALQGELKKAARILWAAKQDTWPDSRKGIMKIFEEKIDPIKVSVMGDFLNSTRNLGDFIKKGVIMQQRIKKIIAREGLVIICLLIVSTSLIYLGGMLSKTEGLVTKEELQRAGVFDYKANNVTSGFDPLSAIPIGSLSEEEIRKLALNEILKREGLHFKGRIVWLDELPENDPTRSESQEEMTQKNRDINDAQEALEKLSDKNVAAFAKVFLGKLDSFAVQRGKGLKFDFTQLGWSLLLWGYSIYLLIRFIVWAIRTLKTEKGKQGIAPD